MTKLSVLLAFVTIIVCDACLLPKPCDGDPRDISVPLIAYTNDPILGTPLKDIPFLFTFTDCTSASSTIVKSDTLFTNEKGRIDRIFKATEFLCSEQLCQPKLEITPLTSKLVRWSDGNNYSYEFKQRVVLKLQIIHDSTDVTETRFIV